jgi:hypothetical protein
LFVNVSPHISGSFARLFCLMSTVPVPKIRLRFGRLPAIVVAFPGEAYLTGDEFMNLIAPVAQLDRATDF